MKKILLLLLLAVNMSFAQSFRANEIIPSSKSVNLEYEEKLVLIAWNNYPENEVLQREVNIALDEVKKAQWTWADIVTVSGNINEFTIDPPSDELANRFFPRYNFGATLKLSMLGQTPAEIRQAKEQLKISEAKVNTQKLNIRATVLRSYRTYVMYKELLQLQTETTEDAYSAYALAEQQFKNGNTTLEEYNLSLDNYNQKKKDRIVAENQYITAKINLEELLGVSLESIR